MRIGEIMANDQWRHRFQIETVCKFSSLCNLKFETFVIVLAKNNLL
jgi:hypothetical protein